MCNYLNNHNNLNGCSLHLVCFLWKMYKKVKCIAYLSGKFSKPCSNKKKKRSLWFQSIPLFKLKYPYTQLANWTIYMLPYWSKKAFFFLKFNAKGGGVVLPPSTFQSGEGNCPQLLLPWCGICEVRTSDLYGASEFMSVRSFSGVCVAQSSAFCEFAIFCQTLNICVFVMSYLYMYIIYCYWSNTLTL